jgi:guanine deaminase
MAHCVWSSDEEAALLKRTGAFVAHCPQSNMNLSSGVAPITKHLDEGLNAGLGSDVAGGSHTSMFRAMTDAIQASKLRWRLYDEAVRPLAFSEAFYLATKGGGKFFGKVGSFEPGYEFDAVAIDDSNLNAPFELGIVDRLIRAAFYSQDGNIVLKYAKGEKVVAGTSS